MQSCWPSGLKELSWPSWADSWPSWADTLSVPGNLTGNCASVLAGTHWCVEGVRISPQGWGERLEGVRVSFAGRARARSGGPPVLNGSGATRGLGFICCVTSGFAPPIDIAGMIFLIASVVA